MLQTKIDYELAWETEVMHLANKLEIMDSITYAKRIQQALIPNENYINKTLNRTWFFRKDNEEKNRLI